MIVAEAFGALAVILNFIGYRQNNVDRYLLISAFGLAALSAHFFMLDAMAAGVGTSLASLRNFIALKNRNRFILFLFVAANIGFLIYEWFVLNHGAIIFIAYASSLIFTVGSIVLRSAGKIRRYFLLAELLGLIYAVSVGSIFGTVFNISNLISILSKIHAEKHTQKA
ncbi:YgjV family protein [Alteromonas sp. 345S023]|uniref:YgjV family protein n=1 Tax=Alteromonas profundi TaxID=2696062 RepID=A0A7X5RMH6_9ALTE|nr:YgjV family protein [Alteromonas profundi]NDV92535.1 YgjV family protein [Alteromonas profundi]